MAESESKSATFPVSVRIDASFTREIQRDVAMKLLNDFIQAWKGNVEAVDERNTVSITRL